MGNVVSTMCTIFIPIHRVSRNMAESSINHLDKEPGLHRPTISRLTFDPNMTVPDNVVEGSSESEEEEDFNDDDDDDVLSGEVDDEDYRYYLDHHYVPVPRGNRDPAGPLTAMGNVTVQEIPWDLRLRLEKLLPERYNEKLCSISDLDDDGFDAVFLVDVRSESEFHQWFYDFQKKSMAKYNTRKSMRKNTKAFQKSCSDVYKFKIYLRCCEWAKSTHSKHQLKIEQKRSIKANCTSTMNVAIFNPFEVYKG